MNENVGIRISGPNSESIETLTESIVRIMSISDCSEHLRSQALEILSRGTEAPNNISISNSTIQAGV